jgi:hypothetical protein
MMPVGSLEELMHAIGRRAVRGLLTVDPSGGQARARRNAAQAAALASALRRQGEQIKREAARYRAVPD